MGKTQKIRELSIVDAATLQKLTNQCQPLLINDIYVNIFLAKYFENTCFLLKNSGEAVGFVSGLRSTVEPTIFFLWQLGIIPKLRGKGLSTLLIEKVVKAAQDLGCHRIQFSIAPGNEQSLRAFTTFSTKCGWIMKVIEEQKYQDPLSGKQGHEIFYELAH
jgi:L-2,4-diaminobutyric acid acetyltransferase